MASPWAAFIGGSYPAQSPAAALERTINWYPEVINTPGASSPLALFPTPGVSTFAAAGASPVRALWAQDGACYAVIGATFYEVASNGTLTSRGTVAVDVGTDPATIVGNGDGGGQLLIVSGGHAYVYETTARRAALDPPTPPATTPVAAAQYSLIDLTATGQPLAGVVAATGAMMDGYFLVLDRDTSTVYQSANYEGQSWDGQAWAQRTAMSDRWVSMVVVNRDLWLLGSETSEVWYNAGTTPFAYALHASGVVMWGTVAPWSAKACGTSLLWLAQTKQGVGQVIEGSGLSAKVISTPALENEFANYDTLADAVADTYDERGHRFYILTFPTAGTTWVYDLTTGLWHERGTWDTGLAAYEAWRPLYAAWAFGQQLIGDRESGTIYTLSADHQTDVGGAVIRRVRRTPKLSDSGRRLFHTLFELDFEPGLGTGVGQGASPVVTLRYSNNRGKTWSTAGNRTADASAQGEYWRRARWNRLGASRHRVYEIVASDPAPWRICGAWLDVRPSEAT